MSLYVCDINLSFHHENVVSDHHWEALNTNLELLSIFSLNNLNHKSANTDCQRRLLIIKSLSSGYERCASSTKWMMQQS